MPLASSDPTRKHITTACLNCRKRKIKCDGVVPSCSHCRLYERECVYQHGQDKRRLPLKERLLALETYTDTLEALLLAHNISLPEKPREVARDETSPTGKRTSPKEPKDDFNQDSARLPFSSEIDTTNLAIHDEHDSSCLVAGGLDPKDGSSSDAGAFSHTDNAAPLMDQLAGSFGSLQIAGDGQLRFFGATSNLHIIQTAGRDSTKHTLNLFRPILAVNDSSKILCAAGVDHRVDPEFEEHLLKLYFCWEDPSIHVVDQQLFYQERESYKSTGSMGNRKLYSDVLVNAMCAVGAALTPRQGTDLPGPLVDFFATRSKALLEVEMDSPSLSTVQSLTILSGVEAILTRDARGWLNSGMAMRLSTDLGLHLDTQLYVDAGIISVEEARLRSIIFWGVFTHERMWSLYMGRPVSLDEKTITVRPLNGFELPKALWKPYVDEFEDFDFPELPDPIEEVHEFNVSLCANMTKIRETLYSDTITGNLGPLELYAFASQMRLELFAWHASLPGSLVVNLRSVSDFYVPHVLQLHMQYHCMMILINRPFVSNAFSVVKTPSMDDAVGHAACVEAASSVSRLLQIYRRLFGFRRINIQAVHLIFTAGLIHACNACNARHKNEIMKRAAWKDLEVCCQALTEIGQGYNNSLRALEVINQIKAQLLEAAKANGKRSSAIAEHPEPHESAVKRRRPGWLPNDQFDADVHPGESAVSTISEPSELTQEQLDPTNAAIPTFDSLFWSEFTNLDFPT